MTRETVSAALDLIDECYIAPVTDKKIRPITTASLSDDIIVTEPSFWRKLGNAAAVVVFVTILTIAFIMMRRSVGPGITPGDTLTDTTDEVTTGETTETEPETPAPEYETYVDGDKVYALYEDHAELIKADSVFGKSIPLTVKGLPVTAIADSVTFADYDAYGTLFGYKDSVVYEYAIEHDLDFVEIYDGNTPENYIADSNEPSLEIRIDSEGIENNVKAAASFADGKWTGAIQNINSDVQKYLSSSDEAERADAKEHILEQVTDHMLRSRYLINAITGGLPSYYFSAGDSSSDYFSNKYRVVTVDSQRNLCRVYDLSCYADFYTFENFFECILNTFGSCHWEDIGEYYISIQDKIYSWQGGEPAVTYSLDGAVYDIEIHLNRIVLTAKTGTATHKFVLERNKHDIQNASYWRWSAFDGFLTLNESTETHDRISYMDVLYTLENGEYWVTGISDASVEKAVIPSSIDGVPVTGIYDMPFITVADPLNFRIFGYEDSFAHDYAVENGYIFIEWFDGTFPDHYYPEGVTLNDWAKAEPNEVYVAVDDNDRIDELVSGYLTGEDTYDELLARVVYRLRCAYDLEEAWVLLQPYYTTELHHEGDYDKYRMYEPHYDANGELCTDEYIWQCFGTIETYDAFMKNIDLLLGENSYRNSYVYHDKIRSADGWLFIPASGAGKSSVQNVTYEMSVEEGKISLSCTYDGYEDNTTSTTLLVRGDDGWYFEKCGCMEASCNLEHLFEEYLDEIQG